jgi:hypothetical protein
MFRVVPPVDTLTKSKRLWPLTGNDRRIWSSRRWPILLLSLVACGCIAEPAASDGQDEAPPPGALRGELVTYTATFDDGTSDDQYFLRVNGDERDERRLLFGANPDLPSGTRLDVWGAQDQGGIQVRRFEVLRRSVAAVQQPLIMGSS